MILCVNNEGGNQLQDQMLHFRMFAKLPLQFIQMRSFSHIILLWDQPQNDPLCE